MRHARRKRIYCLLRNINTQNVNINILWEIFCGSQLLKEETYG